MERPKIVYLWRTNLQWKKYFKDDPIIEVEIPSLARHLRNK